MKRSGIDYVDYSINFWMGCQPVSEGCERCYARRDMDRYGITDDPHRVRRTKPGTWKKIKKFENGSRVFVCPWGDFFHPDADQWREAAWGVMQGRSDLTWLIVTKRIELAAERLPWNWHSGWPNIWIIVTAENQHRLDERLPFLQRLPAAVKGLSVEPMLTRVWLPPEVGVELVLAGCETGPERRLTDTAWIRSLRDQCLERQVPFFLKQMEVNGKVVKMPKLDGRVWDELPGQNGGRG